VASFFIERMPAANPGRPFPPYLYKPLIANIRGLVGSRPLAFAVIGIAFFTFLVAFMRQVVYMHGQVQVPPWTEQRTSVVAGMVGLGIGLGSPLVGYLSAGKVEGGLVPLGTAGMVLATACAAFLLGNVPLLVVCIILVGFFTGFYLVPLFTLLQHRAPKTSKGDVVATSNFLNVTGAIAAIAIFWAVEHAFQQFGLAEQMNPQDHLAGELTDIQFREGKPIALTVRTDTGERRIPGPKKRAVIDIPRSIPLRVDPDAPPQVVVARYEHRGIEHYLVRTQGEDLAPVYDNSHLPQFLFVGAG